MNTRITLLSLVALAGCPDKTDTDTSTPTGTTGETGTTMTAGFVFATDPPSAYVRVDRMGMPAVATVVITGKDAYNAADPSDDAAATFVPEILGNVGALHAALDDDLKGAGLVPCDTGTTCAAQAAPAIIPDTLQIDTTVAAGFPNGRALPDPVIDITLALALLDLSVKGQTPASLVGTNPTANDVAFPTDFPYLAPAQ